MDILLVSLMLIVAVLASNIVSKFIPLVAMPLVQVALGMVLATFLRLAEDFQLPNTLFLMLFVAPLVYADSRGIDRLTAWRNRRTILTLAIGLVVATTLVVGFVMGGAISQLTFGLAFVLGSALSPTDAVAVPSLAKTSDISDRDKTVLISESIVNDATGVVVFNLALASLLTGSFSAGDAAISFCFLFFGGILCGLVVGVLANAVTSLARTLGCDDVVFHVLFELALPFVSFLAAEVMGVSPIMAVMVCAVAFKPTAGKAGPDESRLSIVSTSVWSVLSFALNGFVFTTLGFQLLDSFRGAMATGVSTLELAGAAALLVLIVSLVRYLWLLVMERKSQRPFRRAGLLTFAGGAKGAITMSVALTIPYSVGARSLIVFLVSVTIIASTLLANVMVPLLAPSKAASGGQRAEEVRLVKISILRVVIQRLIAERTKENSAATGLVISDYNKRIRSISERLSDGSDASRREVRLFALGVEERRCTQLMETGSVDDRDGYRYLMHVSQMKAALMHHTALPWIFHRSLRRVRGMARASLGQLRDMVRGMVGQAVEDKTGLRNLQRSCAESAVEALRAELVRGQFPVEDVTQVMMEYRHSIELTDLRSPSITQLASRELEEGKIKLRAVGFELEAIREAQDDGRLTREEAMRMRDDAYLMRLDLEDVV